MRTYHAAASSKENIKRHERVISDKLKNHDSIMKQRKEDNEFKRNLKDGLDVADNIITGIIPKNPMYNNPIMTGIKDLTFKTLKGLVKEEPLYPRAPTSQQLLDPKFQYYQSPKGSIVTPQNVPHFQTWQ